MYIGIGLTAIVVGSLPVCFLWPWVGVLMWSWLGYMNPHRLTWGFSYSMQYAQMVALATLPGVLVMGGRSPLPRTRETYLLIVLYVLFTLSTVFALFPDLAWPQWDRVSKVFLFTFLTLLLFQDKRKLRYLLLTISFSIGFYGIKGGIFAISRGGEYRVIFPEDTMMGDSNGLGLALNMALPMFLFLAREEQNLWLRRLLRAIFILSIPAVVFTYSRGAILGLGAVLVCLAMKIRRTLVVPAGVAAAVLFLLAFAPQKWFDQMETLSNYQNDASAMGRLEAWHVFSRVGLERPLLGAGFWAPSTDKVFFRYLPGARKSRDAHNIFLNVLGEHGVIALGAFVGLIVCCLLTLRHLRASRDRADPPQWVSNYSHMLEASLVGYAVTGFFLSVAYVDLFYHIVAFTILLKVLAERETRADSNLPHTTPVVARAPRVDYVWNRGPR